MRNHQVRKNVCIFSTEWTSQWWWDSAQECCIGLFCIWYVGGKKGKVNEAKHCIFTWFSSLMVVDVKSCDMCHICGLQRLVE